MGTAVAVEGYSISADHLHVPTQVCPDTYTFSASEVQAKQSEIQASQRVRRLIQVRWQEKQHAQLKRQQYKENCQELAALEQLSQGQKWQTASLHVVQDLQQQLTTSLSRTGQGHKAATVVNQKASLMAAQHTADRAAQLQLAKQRFARALQLRHAEQTAAVGADIARFQRMNDTKTAESARAHALAQHHRAVQNEAEANSTTSLGTTWNEAALRNIDYKHSRLHELGGAVIVERNNDRGKAECVGAAETAAELQVW